MHCLRVNQRSHRWWLFKTPTRADEIFGDRAIHIWHQMVREPPSRAPLVVCSKATATGAVRACMRNSLQTWSVAVVATLLGAKNGAVRNFCGHQCSILALAVQKNHRISKHSALIPHISALLAHAMHAWCTPCVHKVRHQHHLHTKCVRVLHNKPQFLTWCGIRTLTGALYTCTHMCTVHV